MHKSSHNLLYIRKKISYIDKIIAKLLKKRSFIIPKVKKVKENWNHKIAFRRESKMAKLLQNNDYGLYNKTYIQKMWRELISATLNIECNLTIGIFKNQDQILSFGLWELAKDHFGIATNYQQHDNINVLLDLLVTKKLDAIILPYFFDYTPWWDQLLLSKYKDVKINLVLPLISRFVKFTNYKAICLSLNNKDIEEEKFYISNKIIESTIDTTVSISNNSQHKYLIQTHLSLIELSKKYSMQYNELTFIGSSSKSI